MKNSTGFFRADASGRLDHGQVALHRHILRDRVARPQRIAVRGGAEAAAFLIYFPCNLCR